MIKISEGTTKKVPGITSVFLSCDYNKELVEEIKNIPCATYMKKTHEWEFPIVYLHTLLDICCKYDDVDFSCCTVDIPQIQSVELNEHKPTLFPYQKDGVLFGLSVDKWLLLDPPGLGKTVQIICLAEELKQRVGIEHCLIICGINTLKTNWRKEIEKHSVLDSIIIGEKISKNGKVSYTSIQERVEQLKNKINEFFVILNVESLRDDNIINAIMHGENKFDMMVTDEIHKVSGYQSQQGKNMLKLNAKYMVGATGTLLQNKPLDAYIPLKWVDIDRSTHSNFENYYCVKSNGFIKEFLGYRNLDTLKKQLDIYSLRRSKDLLELPPKNVIYEYVEMDDSQRLFYDQVKQGVKDDVDKVTLNSSTILGLITRLRQASACPSILSTKEIPSTKIDRAVSLTEELLSNNEKVVIFSTFKDTVGVLSEKLSQYKPLVCTGDVDDETISNNIDKFQTCEDYKVFIGTWQKCGTGITLTKATNMIFIDTPYTDAAFEQACDRIYRVGTTSSVFIYVLVAKDTIDERVKEIVDDKSAISDFILDNRISQKALESLQKYLKEL